MPYLQAEKHAYGSTTRYSLIQRLSNYSRALAQLEAASCWQPKVFECIGATGDDTIFEYTHELSWNGSGLSQGPGTHSCTDRKIRYEKVFFVGLIKDGETWMEMILDATRAATPTILQLPMLMSSCHQYLYPRIQRASEHI
jgi:hypothetical protein